MSRRSVGAGLIVLPFVAFILVIILQITSRILWVDGSTGRSVVNAVSILLGVPVVFGVLFIVLGITLIARSARAQGVSTSKQKKYVKATEVDSKINLPPQQ